ncbi:MAG: hypothetical protein J7500_15860 [Sphingomonas sp.]|uniref:hypothetical protein n=1 Tax=Sphingomonas sp. TaxID=28214 RepID=UPI001B0D1881|nr:hypothetical protein [Sphingomonas sp.]MBO9624184.1 hypothetical protein [Sphingomonas sp.]
MRRIADMLDHPAEVVILCGCVSVKVARPGWLLVRLGPEATIEDGERRLICRKCGQRPTLKPKGIWNVTGGRDRRVDPPPMPDWVDLS